MEKGLRIGEFIISLIVMIGMGVAAWVNVKTNDAKQDEKIWTLERGAIKYEKNQEEILRIVNEINVKLEKKEDRK